MQAILLTAEESYLNSIRAEIAARPQRHADAVQRFDVQLRHFETLAENYGQPAAIKIFGDILFNGQQREMVRLLHELNVADCEQKAQAVTNIFKRRGNFPADTVNPVQAHTREAALAEAS